MNVKKDGGKDRKGIFMKKGRLFRLGMLAILLLAFSMVLSSCDEGDDGGGSSCVNDGKCTVNSAGVYNSCHDDDCAVWQQVTSGTPANVSCNCP